VSTSPTDLPQITIRSAAPGDFYAVTELLAELGRPRVTGDVREIAREVYLRHVARADTASLVAEVDGEVVGFMSLEFRDRLNRTTPQAWIPDLIVTEARRGIGAGKALLLRGFQIARERGCGSVTLESGYNRKVAHEVYRAVGMVELGLFFDKPLP
jgi:GNAT superfamily N-acetyltransferase